MRAAAAFALWLMFAGSIEPGYCESTEALESFTRGRQAVDEGDYRGAFEAFRTARDAGLSGPAIHYNIGVTAYHLGLHDAAESAFIEVARTPAMSDLAHYNLGLVRLARDDPGGAQRWFDRVLADADDPQLRRLAARQLERLTTRVPTPRWVGFGALNTGYDDNVALIGDEGVLATSDLGDGLLEAQAGFAGPLGQRARLEGALWYVNYQDLDAYDQMVGRLGGSYSLPLAAWLAEVNLHLGHSTLDGDGFETVRSLRVQGTRNLTRTSRLRLHYQLDDIEGGSGFESLTGTRQQGSLRYDWRRARLQASLEYRLELNDRRGDDVSPTRHGVDAAIAWRLPAALTLGLEAGYWRSDYGLVASPERDEKRLRCAVAVSHSFNDRWAVTTRYDYADNTSDDEALDYQRNRITLGVNALF